MHHSRLSRPGQPHVAYLIDPRFPGGTSAAVASELRVVSSIARITVHAYASRMFEGHDVAPSLRRTLDDLALPMTWDAGRIAADLVIVHNPCFLKSETCFAPKIITRHLVAVTHENFQRPGGAEPFDVAGCLRCLDRSSFALRRTLAPVSPYNRHTVTDWLRGREEAGRWSLLAEDWHNICDGARGGVVAQSAPADRRGRFSRPGFEKFPPLSVLDACFPRTAAANVILGADNLIRERLHRPHWTMIPFQGVEMEDYFDMIDFMVYYTARTFRESFGRVLAEAVGAGKVVISDQDTASPFGGAVIAARPAEVDDVITRLVNQPRRYLDQVRRGQAALEQYSADAFLARHESVFRDARVHDG